MIHLTAASCLVLVGMAVPAVSAPAGPSDAAGTQASAQAETQPASDSRRADAYHQFILGRHLESDGDVEEAIKAYRQAADFDPSSPEILAELAALYARQNRSREALASADAALKIDPESVEAHRVLGSVYASLARPGDPASAFDRTSAGYAAQAIEHLEAAERLDRGPSEPGQQFLLARLYVATRQFAKALPLLNGLLQQEPDMPEVVALVAEGYQSTGRPDEAIKILAQAARTSPQFYAPLAEFYQRQRRWKEASDAYTEAVAIDPKNLDLKTRLAMVILAHPEAGSTSRARAVLQEVLDRSPADGRALYLMSQAQRALDDLDGAETTARRLVTLRPTSSWGPEALAQALAGRRRFTEIVDLLQPLLSSDPVAPQSIPAAERTQLFIHLGIAYGELGQLDRAISTFEQGAQVLQQTISARPAEPLGYLALADLYTKGQRYREAIDVLRDAEKKFPDDLSMLFQQGAVFERAEQYGEAEQAFRRVIARDPLHALALNYLGYMLADWGERLDEAIGYIRRALAIEPQNGAYLDSLGWAYFRQNKFDVAEVNLRAAASQRGRDSAVQDHLGDLLERTGRYAEAVATWQRALAGDGEQTSRTQIEKKIAAAKEKIKPR